MADQAKPSATVTFRDFYWRVSVKGMTIPQDAKVWHLGLFEGVVVHADAARNQLTLICRSLHQLEYILDEDHRIQVETSRSETFDLTCGEALRIQGRVHVPQQRTRRLPLQRTASRSQVVSN